MREKRGESEEDVFHQKNMLASTFSFGRGRFFLAILLQVQCLFYEVKILDIFSCIHLF